MGFFDLIKKSSSVSFENELPNKDLLYISYDRTIPTVYKGVHISISLDSNGNIKIDNKINQIPDPSTIYFHLPIREEINVAPLPYWPHYIEITPGQRFKYLSWLRNVEQPIDPGYVFLYFYGLERQLLTGNFDKAFDEIIKLRNAHNNKSFLNYSENALVHAAIMCGRTNKLINLREKTVTSGYSNAMFLLAYNAGFGLGVEQLILIFHKAFTTSRNAVKENKPLFIECITEELTKRYGIASFPIKDYDISKVKSVTETRFANYSFPPEIQQVELTDFYQCKMLMEDLKLLFEDSYRIFKAKKSLIKSDKTPEEIEAAILKKNENRYKKLLKEKMITQMEYDILIKYNNGNYHVANSALTPGLSVTT